MNPPTLLPISSSLLVLRYFANRRNARPYTFCLRAPVADIDITLFCLSEIGSVYRLYIKKRICIDEATLTALDICAAQLFEYRLAIVSLAQVTIDVICLDILRHRLQRHGLSFRNLGSRTTP